MSKAPHIIGIPPGKRELWIERHPKVRETRQEYFTSPLTGELLSITNKNALVSTGYWLIPLSTNAKRTLGEYLKLYDNGKIERITLRPDDDDATVLIKPEDK